MWKLFDFAAMSASSRLSADQVLPEFNTPVVEEPINRQRPQETPRRSRGRFSAGAADAESPTLNRTFQDSSNLAGTVPDNLDSLNLSLFDQLPEDWVFTIDDWTLFGAPGSTYFYNEGT